MSRQRGNGESRGEVGGGSEGEVRKGKFLSA